MFSNRPAYVIVADSWLNSLTEELGDCVIGMLVAEDYVGPLHRNCSSLYMSAEALSSTDDGPAQQQPSNGSTDVATCLASNTEGIIGHITLPGSSTLQGSDGGGDDGSGSNNGSSCEGDEHARSNDRGRGGDQSRPATVSTRDQVQGMQNIACKRCRAEHSADLECPDAQMQTALEASGSGGVPGQPPPGSLDAAQSSTATTALFSPTASSEKTAKAQLPAWLMGKLQADCKEDLQPAATNCIYYPEDDQGVQLVMQQARVPEPWEVALDMHVCAHSDTICVKLSMFDCGCDSQSEIWVLKHAKLDVTMADKDEQAARARPASEYILYAHEQGQQNCGTKRHIDTSSVEHARAFQRVRADVSTRPAPKAEGSPGDVNVELAKLNIGMQCKPNGSYERGDMVWLSQCEIRDEQLLFSKSAMHLLLTGSATAEGVAKLVFGTDPCLNVGDPVLVKRSGSLTVDIRCRVGIAAWHIQSKPEFANCLDGYVRALEVSRTSHGIATSINLDNYNAVLQAKAASTTAAAITSIQSGPCS